MATLGELLFYIATQQQDSGGGSVADVSAAWGITSATTGGVTRLLKPGEDEICQHYAVKTIENICSQGGEWAATFSTQVRGGALLEWGLAMWWAAARRGVAAARRSGARW